MKATTINTSSDHVGVVNSEFARKGLLLGIRSIKTALCALASFFSPVLSPHLGLAKTRNSDNTNLNQSHPNSSVSKSAPPKNPNNPVMFSAWREIWQSKSIRAKKKEKNQKPKATSQKPFKLRTEERGKLKEEELLKKMQDLGITEEKQRIPIAQGLPWTTYEPDRLVKPPVKEITRPIDLKLHSDQRAIYRAF